MEHTMTICYCEDESAQAKAFAIKIDQWAKNKNMAVRKDLFGVCGRISVQSRAECL